MYYFKFNADLRESGGSSSLSLSYRSRQAFCLPSKWTLSLNSVFLWVGLVVHL